MTNQLLKVEQVATMLQISIQQVWKLSKAGQLPKPLRINSSVRWRKNDLESFIQNGCSVTAEGGVR